VTSVLGKITVSGKMVFERALPDSLKPFILFRVNDRREKPSQLVKELSVSLATIYRIKKNGFEALKKKNKNISPGRPRKILTFVLEASLMHAE